MQALGHPCRDKAVTIAGADEGVCRPQNVELSLDSARDDII